MAGRSVTHDAAAVEAYIADLRSALEPFAAYADLVLTPQFDSDAIVVAAGGDIALTQGAFHAALRAYRRMQVVPAR